MYNLRVTIKQTNESVTMPIPSIVAELQGWTADKVTASNWMSFLPLIADKYEVQIPKLENVNHILRNELEIVSLNRRCYTKTSKETYARITYLKAIKNQLEQL